MAAASYSRVPEGFVVGFLPVKNVPFATSTLGFVEICGVCSSGTGASSSGASSGSYRLTLAAPTIPYPSIPDLVDGTPEVPRSPFSQVTTTGVDFEADEVEAADGAAVATSEMSEESEESDPDAEWTPAKVQWSPVFGDMPEESEESDPDAEWITEQLFGEVEESEGEAVEDFAHTICPMDESWCEDSRTVSRNDDGRVCHNVPTAPQGEDWEAVWY
jgi:hypothetical protein